MIRVDAFVALRLALKMCETRHELLRDKGDVSDSDNQV